MPKQETRTAEEFQLSMGTGRKPAKYRAEKVKDCRACGFTHDSRAEANRCIELHALAATGALTHIDVHPVVTLERCVRWKLDFLVHLCDGSMHYEDVKGFETRDFKLKLKMYLNSGNPVPLHVVKRDGTDIHGGKRDG